MSQISLTVDVSSLPGTPLPEKMRPQRVSEIIGQSKIRKQIEQYLKSGFLPNLIFWGPPGTGKTSAAEAIGKEVDAMVISVNATSCGAKDLRQIGEDAKNRRLDFHSRTILFVDEIHRFNKAQQDVLLPFIEKGDLTLIGATTENPSYELNKAILSRCRILIFERLSSSELTQIANKALTEKNDSNLSLQSFSDAALGYLFRWVDGDARKLLTAVEEIISLVQSNSLQFPISEEDLKICLGQITLGHDKSSDSHYDLISALIKSIRGSDADAALYYLARLLKGGEDPVFISRRLIILASEDVGNADPRGLSIAVSGAQAVELIGMPEAGINLAQVVTYLSSAPKSNRSYLALKKAQNCVDRNGSIQVPQFLKSGQQPVVDKNKNREYLYPHNFPRNWVQQNYLPEGLNKDEVFYEPSDIGFEKNIREFQKWLRQNTL
jgi:putative ATPase